MAYLIEVFKGASVERIQRKIEEAVEKDERFVLQHTTAHPERKVLDVGMVRLVVRKSYCGQHPGECFIGPRMTSKCLEWDDWVAFHSLVNDVLDRLRVSANVTTKPREIIAKVPGLKRGYFYIRIGRRRRIRFDWEDNWTGQAFRPRQIWNAGTDDQFVEERHARREEFSHNHHLRGDREEKPGVRPGAAGDRKQLAAGDRMSEGLRPHRHGTGPEVAPRQ